MNPIPTPTPAQVAETFMSAFNAGDWESFQAALHPDLAYQETGTGQRTEGAENYLQLIRGWKQVFPDATATVRQTVHQGNVVVQELFWEGTQTGALPGPGGTLPPSGRRIAVIGSLWYTCEGGRIRTLHHHLDLLTMLQQLGALPAPG